MIVPGYNNNDRFRIEYNLNSIFQQNYTNYFVVIIDDASTDKSEEVYRMYLDFYGIEKSSFIFIENKERKTALENIYIATHSYCSTDSVAMVVDADDELIGKNVLKVFNAAYQQKKAGVIYSNFFYYKHASFLRVGFTGEYSDREKDQNQYR